MRKFSLRVEVLVSLFILSCALHLGASRYEPQAGVLTNFMFYNGLGGRNRECITEDGGQQGVCIHIDRCDEANLPPWQRKRFQRLRSCDFSRRKWAVCCVTNGPLPQSPSPQPPPSQPPPPPQPPPSQPPPSQPPPPPQPPPSQPPQQQPPSTFGSASRLVKESDLSKICGIKKSTGIDFRIVGGTKAPLKGWPWMAAIFMGPSSSSVGCGGVLISEQYVLTAAHCIFNTTTKQKLKISEFVIRLGDLNIDDNNDGATPINLSAVELITHENYNPSTSKNDIALIKLGQIVKFTDQILPICLPSSPPMSNDLYVGRQSTVAGWGTLEFHGKSSSKLLEVAITVQSNSECQAVYNNFKVTIADTQLCAGYRDGGKDACQGDSGGPLMLANADKWYTIGVVSIGFKCAQPGFPGIYTRTTSYINWIKKNAKIQ